MHKNFLILFWEITSGGEENQNNFIQKALKLSKTLKVKSLGRPMFDVLQKRQPTISFYV